MKPFTTLQKFVTIIHRTYKKIFAVIAVKCLIYMLQTLYATALVSGFIWCLEQPNVKKGWLGIIGLAVAGLLIACIKRMIDHNYEVHEERMKEALDHSIFDKISNKKSIAFRTGLCSLTTTCSSYFSFIFCFFK